MKNELMTHLTERFFYAVRRAKICRKENMRCSEGRRIFYASRNPLLSAEHSRFLSFDTPVGTACVLTGCFGKEGFFSAFCSSNENAAEAMMRWILEEQEKWGTLHITGPVAPAYFDVDGGWPVSGFEEETSCFAHQAPAYMDSVMKRFGFKASRNLLLFRLENDHRAYLKYKKAAEWAQRRYGFTVVSAKRIGERRACKAMKHVLSQEPLEGMTAAPLDRILEELGSQWSRELTFIAFAGDEPVGYLLGLCDKKSGIVRVATAQVTLCWQRRGAAAGLAAAFLDATHDSPFIECGVIEEGNNASRWSVENAGGRVIRQIKSYILDKS